MRQRAIAPARTRCSSGGSDEPLRLDLSRPDTLSSSLPWRFESVTRVRARTFREHVCPADQLLAVCQECRRVTARARSCTHLVPALCLFVRQAEERGTGTPAQPRACSSVTLCFQDGSCGKARVVGALGSRGGRCVDATAGPSRSVSGLLGRDLLLRINHSEDQRRPRCLGGADARPSLWLGRW